jgi:hypothetical protein
MKLWISLAHSKDFWRILKLGRLKPKNKTFLEKYTLRLEDFLGFIEFSFEYLNLPDLKKLASFVSGFMTVLFFSFKNDLNQ